MSKALIILTFFVAFPAFAVNHILFMGGGAEPENSETTIFDAEVKNVGAFLNDNRKTWNAQMAFNGGHSKTEELLNKDLVRITGEPNKPFSKKNFLELLDEYEKKIDRGDIKPGDQILVYITTHGAQKNKKSGKTHEIALSGKSFTNFNTLEGANLVSMDQLQGLIEKAEAKGVKLGIMDFSCHSGASINLKNPHTCIITASGPNNFGYSTWGERFARNMRKGTSLENVFLKTFSESDEPAFPMISTNSGVAIQEQLYDLLNPYLHSWNANPNHEKLSEYLNHQAEQNQCVEGDTNLNQLAQVTANLENRIYKTNDGLRDLKKAITEYHEFQAKMKEDLRKFNIVDLKLKKEKVCVTWQGRDDSLPPSTNCMTWTYEQLLNVNFNETKAHYLKKKETEPELARWYEGQINLMDETISLRKKILDANPNYLQFQSYYSSFPDLEEKTRTMARKVSKALQKLYPLIYKEKSKTDKAPNPCQNFVL